MQAGGCLCGQIRYEVDGEPLKSGICHCRSCRKAASSPMLPFVVFPVEALRFTAGEPRSYRSSPDVVRTFCGRCGSPLTYVNAQQPSTIDIMPGSLDDPDAFPPTSHVWTAEKLAWVPLTDGLPAYRTSAAAGDLV